VADDARPVAIDGVTINDVDAGGEAVQLSVRAPVGHLDATPHPGVIAGRVDDMITLTGAVDAIQAALADGAVTWTPQAATDDGTAVIELAIDDLGNSGAGGSQRGTAVLAVHVRAASPIVPVALYSPSPARPEPARPRTPAVAPVAPPEVHTAVPAIPVPPAIGAPRASVAPRARHRAVAWWVVMGGVAIGFALVVALWRRRDDDDGVVADR
jgi:hypothetical protein